MGEIIALTPCRAVIAHIKSSVKALVDAFYHYIRGICIASDQLHILRHVFRENVISVAMGILNYDFISPGSVCSPGGGNRFFCHLQTVALIVQSARRC